MKCRLVIFVSSVLRRFGPGPSSVEFKYVRIVARFAYAMKKKQKQKQKTIRSRNEEVGQLQEPEVRSEGL